MPRFTAKRSLQLAVAALLIFQAVLVVFSHTEEHKEWHDDGDNKAASPKAFICYWGSWAYYRSELGNEQNKDLNFTADSVDTSMCTHLIYSFAGLNSNSNKIHSLDPYLDLTTEEVETNMEDGIPVKGDKGMFQQAVNLKIQNPDLKVLIAIGGWGQGSGRFSNMAADLKNRTDFITSVMEFIEKYRFDGLDMDWEYPGQREGSQPQDKENFVTLLQELRKKFSETNPKLLLTAALGAGPATVAAAYDVPGISEHLDFLNIMAYDLKVYVPGEWELIGHHSPLYPKDSESAGDKSLSVSAAIQNYLKCGAPPEKLALGVGAYGKTYTMKNASSYNFYDPVLDAGPRYGFSQEAGTIFYSEICYYIARKLDGWNFGFDYEYNAPFAHNGSVWIGYDDERSIIEKVDYADKMGLGGMMIWSIDQDDFQNNCGGWYKNAIGGTVKRRLDYHYHATRPRN